MPTRTDDEKDEKLDRAVEDSFPASDPPANSGIVGPRAARPMSCEWLCSSVAPAVAP